MLVIAVLTKSSLQPDLPLDYFRSPCKMCNVAFDVMYCVNYMSRFTASRNNRYLTLLSPSVFILSILVGSPFCLSGILYVVNLPLSCTACRAGKASLDGQAFMLLKYQTVSQAIRNKNTVGMVKFCGLIATSKKFAFYCDQVTCKQYAKIDR